MYFKGKITLYKLFCFPSEKWFTLKSKEFAPIGSKFFPFRVDPFSEGEWYTGKQTKSQKLSSHHENMPV